MKTLVAFFSHAGENYFTDGMRVVTTGNAKIIAEKAQRLLDAGIFEIDTVKQYSNNYKICCDEALEEQKRGELPELKEYISSIEEFDRIILVYPCWWGTMPQAVFTFLHHYNFAGKVILPICTHEGSGMGRSESDIAKVCPGAKVERGIAIQGSYADVCDDKLKRYFGI